MSERARKAVFNGVGFDAQAVTLRDYFAARAMALVAVNGVRNKDDAAVMAERAYMVADAMLRAREVRA
jgi:hypothetical protein